MGWWANLGFRGAANRSSVKLAERFGPGPGTEILAIAFAYACYPKGRYGDNAWCDDTLSQIKALPFKPCDPKKACGHVENWLDRGVLSATDAFEFVWGVNVDDFARTLIEKKDAE